MTTALRGALMRRLRNHPEQEVIVCYAEGTEDSWEAYCLTFDLAVQGRCFDDVRQKLDDQIGLFLEGVESAPEAERSRLLRRRAPWWAWVRPMRAMLQAALLGRDAKERHEYSFRRRVPAAA